MEGPRKYLYIVKWWEPFPRSEYGGLIIVVARDDAECIEILNKQYNQPQSLHQSGDPTEAVRTARRFLMDHSGEESGIVEALIT